MTEQLQTEDLAMDPEELRDAAARLLRDLVDRRVPYVEEPAAWRERLFSQVVEQGWTLLTLPAELGGLGQTFAALAPIYEEMGKAVSPVFLAPTLAALEAVRLATRPETAAQLAEAIGRGAARLAASLLQPGAFDLAGEGGRLQIRGVAPGVVLDPGTTHLLLLSPEQPLVLLVDLAAPGVARRSVEMWDRSRQAADISLDAAPAVGLAEGLEAVERVRSHLDLALAWDSIGGARQSLEETISYMGVRQQFGRPIGSFQALKHRAADHKVALEMAAALAREATAAFAESRPHAALMAGQARLIANQAYRAISEDAVQMHGGIGFTWEHDCHLFLKRAWLNDMLFGAADERRDSLAPGLLARAAADRQG